MEHHMKSVQFDQTGKPADVLQIREVPIPEPGPGEIRIRVSMGNINPSDIMFIQGMYGIAPRLPATGGFEAAGVVDAAGEGAGYPVGQRVLFTAIGVWQEYVVVPAHSVIPAPPDMSDELACQAFVNPFTAYAMLEVADLKEGDWLMLTAGGSAFGKFVIQLCKDRGIHTLCTVRRDDQTEALLKLGATAVVNTKSENLVKVARSHTEGKGVHAVFDAVGGKLGAQALECLRRDGTMHVFGLLSLEMTPANTGIMIFRNLHIRGFWLTTWLASKSREEMAKITREVLTRLSTEQLKADVEAVYPLEDIHKAVEHADRPGRSGKVLLDLR